MIQRPVRGLDRDVRPLTAAAEVGEPRLNSIETSWGPLSTDPHGDLEIVLKRALFAWLMAAGDMHLKNVA